MNDFHCPACGTKKTLDEAVRILQKRLGSTPFPGAFQEIASDASNLIYELHRRLTAAERKIEEDECWKDMETAPKDGRVIKTYDAFSRNGRVRWVAIGIWNDGRWFYTDPMGKLIGKAYNLKGWRPDNA